MTSRVAGFSARHHPRVALVPCSDLSAAAWLLTGDQPWHQLVGFGPAIFPAHARLRFLPDPAYDGQSEYDVDVDELLEETALTETARLRAVLSTLARHTGTPEDCYFCLWDGWGAAEMWPGQPRHDIPDPAFF